MIIQVWDRACVFGGPSSEELLVSWLLEDDNYAKWKSKDAKDPYKHLLYSEFQKKLFTSGFGEISINAIKHNFQVLQRQMNWGDFYFYSTGAFFYSEEDPIFKRICGNNNFLAVWGIPSDAYICPLDHIRFKVPYYFDLAPVVINWTRQKYTSPCNPLCEERLSNDSDFSSGEHNDYTINHSQNVVEDDNTGSEELFYHPPDDDIVMVKAEMNELRDSSRRSEMTLEKEEEIQPYKKAKVIIDGNEQARLQIEYVQMLKSIKYSNDEIKEKISRLWG